MAAEAAAAAVAAAAAASSFVEPIGAAVVVAAREGGGRGRAVALASSPLSFVAGTAGSLCSALASAAAAEAAAPPPPRAGGGGTGAHETDTEGADAYPPASALTALAAPSDIRSAASLQEPRGTPCGARSPAVVAAAAPP